MCIRDLSPIHSRTCQMLLQIDTYVTSLSFHMSNIQFQVSWIPTWTWHETTTGVILCHITFVSWWVVTVLRKIKKRGKTGWNMRFGWMEVYDEPLPLCMRSFICVTHQKLRIRLREILQRFRIPNFRLRQTGLKVTKICNSKNNVRGLLWCITISLRQHLSVRHGPM